MTNLTFEEKLAKGTAGEDIVYDYLIRNCGYVEDLRKEKLDKYGGPRLRGTEGSIVLPDFSVYTKHKGAFAVDVKVKTSLYPVNGKKCFTVDNKFEQYKRAVQIKRLDYLMIIFIYEGKMYFYKDSDCCGTTTFNNQHGNGLVYCFEFDEKKWVY